MASKKIAWKTAPAPYQPDPREALRQAGKVIIKYEDTHAAAEALRQELLHLLVDLNLNGHGKAVKLAGILSALMGKPVSRNTLCMALSGYRLTPRYVEYLQKLKDHLQSCKQKNINPVSLYTGLPKNQEEKEINHVA